MSDLDNSISEPALRRIVIDPVSRVEGHGKVTLLLDELNRVKQTRLHIVEFRGFESFIEGRPYWEVPVTVQRLCGICPVSHQLAAVKAMDQIAGYGSIPPTAEKLRRLLHYGQMLQSHALHFFHLASPDILLGFDSEVARRNIIGVAQDYPEIARQGVLLRKFGQEVVRMLTGKRVHGTGAIPGGMNQALSPGDRATLQQDIDQVVDWCRSAVQMMRRLHETNPGFYTGFGVAPSGMMSLVRPDGALDFYDGALRVVDVNASPLFDQVAPDAYANLIHEEIKSWSYMKFPYLAQLGPEHGSYKVGPLARMQTAAYLPTPLAEQERAVFVAQGQGSPLHSPLMYHWARLIEMLHAAELIRELLDDPVLIAGDLIGDKGAGRQEAVGVIEAPRGTLIHHYRVDENHQVSYCNLIVATTHNNTAMNEAVRVVAGQYLEGRVVTEGLLNHIECAIRAFDPCLSCATHALGKMPMRVELLSARGETLHVLGR
jgi:NAD-reducing hydrogenase large subunit